MKKLYKGYYIDGAIFHCEKDVDEHIKTELLRSYKIALEVFYKNRDFASAEYVERMGNQLVDKCGLTWEQVEELEIELMKA